MIVPNLGAKLCGRRRVGVPDLPAGPAQMFGLVRSGEPPGFVPRLACLQHGLQRNADLAVVSTPRDMALAPRCSASERPSPPLQAGLLLDRPWRGFPPRAKRQSFFADISRSVAAPSIASDSSCFGLLFLQCPSDLLITEPAALHSSVLRWSGRSQKTAPSQGSTSASARTQASWRGSHAINSRKPRHGQMSRSLKFVQNNLIMKIVRNDVHL